VYVAQILIYDNVQIQMPNTAANQEPGKNKPGKGLTRVQKREQRTGLENPGYRMLEGSQAYDQAYERIGGTFFFRILIDKFI
jgi:hypothetical protein